MKPGRLIPNPLHAPRWPALGRPFLIAAAVMTVGLWTLHRPASTRFGIDFRVTQQSIPLSTKALAFLHRDAEYRLLSRQLLAGESTDEAKALAVLAWTAQRIRPTPAEWPVIDDHVWHIIVRGHGLPDQMADVFTTLLSYGGVRAFWRPVITTAEPPFVPSFVRLNGRWALVDVARGMLLRDAEGRPLDAARAIDDPAYLSSQRVASDAEPLVAALPALRPFAVPDVTRAEQQMLWPRVGLELRRFLRRAPARGPILEPA